MNASTTLSDAILETIDILSRGSESVRAVLMGEENRFTRALVDLKVLAEKENIPLAIVGGLGAIRYGYPAATQDIDIVVAKIHRDTILQAAFRHGFTITEQAKTGWHTLMHGDVEINIVPDGAKARTSAPTTIPGPETLGVSHGLGYADLPGWMELKLSTGRQKDKAHIVEVLKTLLPEQFPTVRNRIASVDPAYLRLLDELHVEAMDEKEQEKRRDE